MPDGVDRGGLDYNINVGGNFEEQFAKFEALIKKTETQGKTADKSTGKRVSKQGEQSAKNEAKARERVTVALNKQNAVERKILALKKRQEVAVSGQVQKEQVITDTVERRAKATVAVQKAQLKTTKQSISQSRAEERIARASLKRLEIERAIQLARAKGAVTPAQISTVTGVSTTQLAQVDKAIADQNSKLKEQESIRKKNLALQKKQTAQAAANKEQQRKIEQLARKQGISHKKAAKELGISASKARQLGFEMNKAADVADRFLFTFRRLVGILAIFTLARRLAQFIGDGVREMTRFNAVLELSKISLASLIAGAGILVDEQGNIVDGATEYKNALLEAEQVQKRLRIDALGTVATYEQLLGAFQAGVAPGLAAGLDVDEIRIVSVSLAKAASAMGIEGDKFAEEIRSVLSGTGTAKNTFLLRIPGLDNKSIERATEQNRLVEQIMESTRAFGIATIDVAKSWDGLKSQIKDATSSLLASGSVEYFETLKDTMGDFLKSLIVVQETSGQAFALNPTAIGAVQEVSFALRDIVQSFRSLVSFDEFFETIRSNAALAGEALRAMANVFIPIVVGIGRGVALFNKMLATVIKIFRFLGNLPVLNAFVKVFQKVLVFVSQIGGFILSWLVLTKAYNAILLGTRALLGSISIISSAITAIQIIWLDIVAGYNKGLTITQAILTAIKATISVTSLIFTAIAVIIGVVLVKTGVISKLFDKLNESLGMTTDGLAKTNKELDKGKTAIIGQSQAVKQLREGFQAVQDKILATQNAIKAQLLTSAIRSEARKAFSTFADGYEDINTRLADADKRLASLREELAAAEIKRNAEIIESVEEREEAIRKAQEAGRSFGGIGTAFTPQIPAGILASTGASEIEKEQIENNKQLVRLKGQIKQLDDERTAQLEEELKLLALQVKSEVIRFRTQTDGTQLITAEFDLRKALIEEEVRNARAIVKEYKIQQVVLAEQEALLVKNNEIRDEELRQLDKLIEDSRKLNEEGKANEDLENVRLSTAKKFELERKKEAAVIRTMRNDMEELAAIAVNNDWLEAMSAGFRAGVQEFIDSADTLAEGFTDAIVGGIESAIDRTSDALTDLFDPRTEGEDPAVIAGEVLLDIVNDMINTILTDFVANLLSSFLVQQTSAQIQAATTTANTAATTAGTVAATTNTGALIANTGTVAAASTGMIAALLANTVAVTANTAAVLLDVAVPGYKGGLVSPGGGFARGLFRGGMVDFGKLSPARGYATGGNVASHPRPSHISSVDTVPAWLQPGEYVIPKSRVQQYGARFFEMLRRGTITPEMGQKHLAANISRSKGVFGLAAGGVVPGPSTMASRQSDSDSGGGTTTVLPVVVADDNTVDQLISGGRDAFDAGVNDTPDNTNPNVSNSSA